MLERAYNWFMRITSRREERGEYSAGYWQAKIRQAAIGLSSDIKGRLLEVGCGEGLFLIGLHKANPGIQLWGADPWGGILDRARRLLADSGIDSINLSEYDGRRLPFEDGFFDAVVCVNVFLNMATLGDMQQALKEMARVCKAGGRVIIEFRNSFNLLVVLKFKLARFYDETIRERNLPLSTYFKKDVLSVMHNLGFNISRELYLDSPVKFLAPIIILESVKA